MTLKMNDILSRLLSGKQTGKSQWIPKQPGAVSTQKALVMSTEGGVSPLSWKSVTSADCLKAQCYSAISETSVAKWEVILKVQSGLK